MSPWVDVLAFSSASWFAQYTVWWIAGAIVIGGLLLFGLQDVRRLQPRRVWAISSVSFAESLRRKVLWVTPLAILGVIVVAQLQHPSAVGGSITEEETIRQTIKYCLFASGLLVTITAIILACTNLPREIENRVIFTIVTKPTTRLEIVLGKVLGFIRVSGLIVLIMGLFTLSYLEIRAHLLRGEVEKRLNSEPADSVAHHTLQGYVTAGLLSTKSLEQSVPPEIYPPIPYETDMHWLPGGNGYFFELPFELDQAQVAALQGTQTNPPTAAMYVINTIRIKRGMPTKTELDQIRERSLPMERPAVEIGPLPENETVRPIPQLSIHLLDENRAVMIGPKDIELGKRFDIPPPEKPDEPSVIPIELTPEQLSRVMSHPHFYVAVVPETPSVQYEITATPTVVDIRAAEREQVIKPAPDKNHAGQTARPRFLGKANRYGMQVAGSPDGNGSVAVYRFRGAEPPPKGVKTADFQFRAGIERSGDYNAGEDYSRVQLTVIDKNNGQASPPVVFAPESNRDYYVSVPAEFLQSGNFDVLVRGLNNGQWLGITDRSLQYVAADRSFVLNLLKSLLILWLLSIMVVIVSVFCSTFLSWPIAIILTLLILLGHWSVEQLGDALNPGVGRSVSRDLGVRDVPAERVTVESVEALAKMLRVVSSVLPDVSKFPVMEDIERGISIPAARIGEALGVLACYGLPLLVLSFVILKNKEVAP